MSEYTRTAQALAHTIDDDPPGNSPPQRSQPPRRSSSSFSASSPVFHNNNRRSSLSSAGHRRSGSSYLGRRSNNSSSHRNRNRRRFFLSRLLPRSEIVNEVLDTASGLLKRFNRLKPVNRVLLAFAGLVALVLGVLFLVFNERIFHALAPVARKWRGLKGGWCILWAATFVVGFPPLIGYSSAVTLAGFVYGVPKGWLIAASGTILGSTASFLLSRTLLRSYVERLTSHDKRFAALALTLKHDGVKLLIMIRLCPLPYSLSNGAISTIPTITWYQFMLASVLATPKLVLHVFVGSRLGAIAESGDKMDAKTKAISYLSIVIGLVAGVVTGWFMYTKTKARARELEAEEGDAAARIAEDGAEPRFLADGDDDDDDDDDDGHDGFGLGDAAELAREQRRYQYSDDPMERAAAQRLAVGDDDFSMHSTSAAAADVVRGRDGGSGSGPYHDGFSDVEDAEEFRDDVDSDDVDPFRDGDGDGDGGKK